MGVNPKVYHKIFKRSSPASAAYTESMLSIGYHRDNFSFLDKKSQNLNEGFLIEGFQGSHFGRGKLGLLGISGYEVTATHKINAVEVQLGPARQLCTS